MEKSPTMYRSTSLKNMADEFGKDPIYNTQSFYQVRSKKGMIIMLYALINSTPADCGGEGIWYNLWEKEIAWLIVFGVAVISIFLFWRFSRITEKQAAGSMQSKV